MRVSVRTTIVGLAVAFRLAQGSFLAADTPATGAARSGIEGETVIGPVRPSQRIDEPPPPAAPYSASLVVLRASDRTEVARVTSGSDGRFRLELPPGDYVVARAPDAAVRAPRAEPVSVTVRAGEFSSLTIPFDNGMR